MANQSIYNWTYILSDVTNEFIEYESENLTAFEAESNRTWKYTEPLRDPLFIVIPITIIYVLIFITGLIGNVSTCVVIARNKSMHTATNYYLFSLAISDLLLLISGLPQEVYSIWYRYPYIFGEVFCVVRGMAAETSTNATVLTITAFTIERYLAICHPFLSHTMSKLSRAMKLIFVIWVVSLVFAIPQALQFGIVMHRDTPVCTQKIIIIDHSFEISTFLFFVTPMTLITLLYALIGLRLRSSNMMCRERPRKFSETSKSVRSGTSSKYSGARKVTNLSSRRVLKMLIAVVVAFFICWAPFHVQRLVAIYGTVGNHTAISPLVRKIYVVTTYISGILYYLSTTVNPFLYHIMSVKFREAFKETFEAGIQCKEQWKEEHKEENKCNARMARKPRDAYLGIFRQERSDYFNNSGGEETVDRESVGSQYFVSTRSNRASCRRNSGGTEQFTSSSYVKSRSLSVSTSHDTVLIPNKCKTLRCCSQYENSKEISNEKVYSCAHVHYSTNEKSLDLCHFCMKTTGCCLDNVIVKEKRPKSKYFWQTMKFSPDNTNLINKSFVRIVNPRATVENETQTDSDILNATASYFSSNLTRELGKDELSSYMEEIHRREKLNVIN